MRSNNVSSSIFCLVAVILLLLVGCQTPKKEKQKINCVINGCIEGCSLDNIPISYEIDGEEMFDTIECVSGNFIYEKYFEYPCYITLNLVSGGKNRFDAEAEGMCLEFFADSGNIEVLAIIGELKDPIIKGCKYQDDYQAYMKAIREYRKKNNYYEKYSKIAYAKEATKEDLEKTREIVEEGQAAQNIWMKGYFKKNPTNLYVISMVYSNLTSKTGGKSAKDMKEWIDIIDPSIYNHPTVKRTRETWKNMMETEVNLDKFIGNAVDATYKTDKSYPGTNFNKISYLSVFPNDDICALKGTYRVIDSPHSEKFKNRGDDHFSIQIISPKGKLKNEFEMKTNDLPSVVGVDNQSNIYVINSELRHRTIKIRGKDVKVHDVTGVNCVVYDTKGEVQRKFKVEGIKKPTGCKLYCNKLYISDSRGGQIRIYDKEDGSFISSVDNVRSCCSILDIDVDNEGTLFVASLGAFRVYAYDQDGNKLLSFGKKGKDINSFSGCCNPVSLSRLDNGCIITVEKTPTRIKVYGKNGAKTIDGIEELVKGCDHIPVISDSKNNIYLASPEKGIVKCVIK